MDFSASFRWFPSPPLALDAALPDLMFPSPGLDFWVLAYSFFSPLRGRAFMETSLSGIQMRFDRRLGVPPLDRFGRHQA